MSIRMGKSLDTEEPAAVAGSKLEPPYFLVKLVLGKASNAAEPAPAHSPFNLSRIEEVGRFFRGSMPVGTDLLNRYFIFRYVDHAGQDRWTIAHDERHTHRGSTGNLHFAPANDSHPAGGGRVTTPRPNPEKHASSTPRSVTPPEHDEHGDSPHALQHVAATAEEHVASPETL
ncbi:uncharacterized protein LOC129591795 isoform X2 [Paramacrobiotus metropolitanus]|nr:uncharacterized protein LOC129591795 isoform X2 [Paramacrobiotus metropolitanus]